MMTPRSAMFTLLWLISSLKVGVDAKPWVASAGRITKTAQNNRDNIRKNIQWRDCFILSDDLSAADQDTIQRSMAILEKLPVFQQMMVDHKLLVENIRQIATESGLRENDLPSDKIMITEGKTQFISYDDEVNAAVLELDTETLKGIIFPFLSTDGKCIKWEKMDLVNVIGHEFGHHGQFTKAMWLMRLMDLVLIEGGIDGVSALDHNIGLKALGKFKDYDPENRQQVLDQLKKIKKNGCAEIDLDLYRIGTKIEGTTDKKIQERNDALIQCYVDLFDKSMAILISLGDQGYFGVTIDGKKLPFGHEIQSLNIEREISRQRGLPTHGVRAYGLYSNNEKQEGLTTCADDSVNYVDIYSRPQSGPARTIISAAEDWQKAVDEFTLRQQSQRPPAPTSPRYIP
jgi:hypothetical protein